MAVAPLQNVAHMNLKKRPPYLPFKSYFSVTVFSNSTTVESTLVGSKKKQKGTLMFKWLKICFKMVLSLLEHVSSINEHIRHWLPNFFIEKYDFWKKKFGAAVFPYVSLCIAFKQFLTKNGFWGWSELFFENLPKIDSKSNSVLANP